MQETNKFLVPLSIVIAGALIAFAIYAGGSNTSGPKAQDLVDTKINVPPVSASDHIVGSRSAEVIIIEYSDTECPFCKVFHNSLKEIVTSYEGKVAWVYRHFPIAQLHSKAIKEAEATECAAELGGNQGFWNYINRLFEVTNSNDSLDPAELPKIATFVGLDAAAFTACLDSGKYNKKVLDSVTEAVKIGALGTPYSVLVTPDGRKVVVNGAEPIAQVKTKIDLLLK